MKVRRTPLVVVIAGPNGAGKSTTAPRLLRGAFEVSEFVNADAVARGLSAFRPESVAIGAGRVMLERIHALVDAEEDFAFETTLASRSFAPWLRGLRERGFRLHVAFLSLPNAALAVGRVAARVREGGHDVPTATVRRRFVSGLPNFFGTYRDLADSWQMFDNSGWSNPRLIGSRAAGEKPVIHRSVSVAAPRGDRKMKPLVRSKRSVAERVNDLDRILCEMQLAVREALWRHKRLGQSVVIWQDGQVVWVAPQDIPIDDSVPPE